MFRPMIAALVAFAVFAVGRVSGEEPAKPNLIVILTDDLGYADVACNGGRSVVTPNIDRMAAEGMRFTSFCVTQGQCSPSRASLLTGCYANRIGINQVLGPNSKLGLSPDELNIAQMCKAGGYATCALGKWHLGDHPSFLPTSLGFDSWWGVPYSHDMWPVGYDGKPSASRKWPPLRIMQGEQKLEQITTLDDQAKLTASITERAVAFIRENKDKPFFLYVAHPMPHVPIAASPAFVGQSGKGLYADVIMEIDWSVGEILSAVDQSGLGERTLVVFTSDNGPWMNFGDHAGSATPLREGKGTEWEGGVRVPCIIRWTGQVPAGTVYNGLASTIDVLPTFSAIAGLAGPTKPIDGVDISPVLRGGLSKNPRTEFLYYYGNVLEAVRKGDWKLHLPHEYRNCEGVAPGRDGYPGEQRVGRTAYELYNLMSDVGERRNVADLHPKVVQELREIADAAVRRLGSGKQAGPEQRAPGRLDAKEPE